MDMHNDPIDYAVAVTDDRVRKLLRERSLQQEPGQEFRAQYPWTADHRQSEWALRIVLAEPLIVGVAGFLLGWLVSQRS